MLALATLWAVATCCTSTLWPVAWAALVTVTPSRLSAAEGAWVSARLAVANACLARKMSALPSKLTLPRSLSTAVLRASE